ncbi:MAG TPA: enolase C-terminal domain-like protein [Opitutaceae bacterium]
MSQPAVTSVTAEVFRVPTDRPESDGTAEWRHTDFVVVHASAGGHVGLGWTYASEASAKLVSSILGSKVTGISAFATGEAWSRMSAALRNVGRPGAGAMATSAVDMALWDLKARIMNQPLVELLGRCRSAVALYGSGGFTSYSEQELMDQLSGWSEGGLASVKMKVGRDAAADRRRVVAARGAVGAGVRLMADANGAYTRKEALHQAEAFADQAGVAWFEEPVSSDDLEGLRLMRDRAPAGLEIAAGEYGDSPWYFRSMLEAGAVDCLQADATRCGGFTGFIKAAALAESWHLPLSAHCAPQLHAHVGCAAATLRDVEWFHDHVRADGLLFDGVLAPRDGALHPDASRIGHGLTLKVADAERFRL